MSDATLSGLDHVTIMSSLISGTLIAAAGPDITVELFPISAGISGAMLSIMRGRTQRDFNSTRMQVVSSFLCGVAAALFIAPMVTGHVLPVVLGKPDFATRTFVHLLMGLMGTYCIDEILEYRKRLTAAGAKKIFGENLKKLSEETNTPSQNYCERPHTESSPTETTEESKPTVE
jgi:hypothetical protein